MPHLFLSDIYLCNEIQGSFFFFFSPMCFTQYFLCDIKIHHTAGPVVPIRLYIPTVMRERPQKENKYMWPEEVNFNFFLSCL